MIKRTILAAGILILSSSGPCWAYFGPALSVGVHMGISNLQNDKVQGVTTEFDRANIVGLSAGIRQDHVGVELTVEWMKTDLTANNFDLGSLKTTPVLLTAQFHFLPEDFVVDPYLGAGVGYYLNSFNGSSGSSGTVDDAVGFHLAGGANLLVTTAVAISLDLRYAFAESDLTAAGFNDKLRQDGLVVTGGIKYIFPH
jgi:outer membrane protein